MQSHTTSQAHTRQPRGSLDGSGAADHDQPYRFGWKPSANVPYPFNTRQYSRLLVLRGRIQDGACGADDVSR
jgi:hypothetical protein